MRPATSVVGGIARPPSSFLRKNNFFVFGNLSLVKNVMDCLHQKLNIIVFFLLFDGRVLLYFFCGFAVTYIANKPAVKASPAVSVILSSKLLNSSPGAFQD